MAMNARASENYLAISCSATLMNLTEFNAPLALKDPVFCKFSALKNAFRPINLSNVELHNDTIISVDLLEK
jgi:hypothetical protein